MMSTSELTAQEKKQLLAALRELSPRDNAERRRNKRRDVRLNLCIRKIKSGKLQASPGKKGLRAVSEVDMFTATVINVAAAGVGLMVRKPLDSGDKLLLPLRFREGGGWLVLCEGAGTAKSRNRGGTRWGRGLWIALKIRRRTRGFRWIGFFNFRPR